MNNLQRDRKERYIILLGGRKVLFYPYWRDALMISLHAYYD